MNTKNFPGRKNIRRVAALARFAAVPMDRPDRPSRTQSEHDAEYLRLSKAIIPQAQADAIRTKKDRSARGRITR